MVSCLPNIFHVKAASGRLFRRALWGKLLQFMDYIIYVFRDYYDLFLDGRRFHTL